ncbi:MAG: MoaF C-terminal domain-containing protein [Terrimesophilobacter sp.]
MTTSNQESALKKQEFVAPEDWPDVSVMLQGFGLPTLPDSDELVGESIDVGNHDGSVVRLRFTSIDSLDREVLEGAGAGEAASYAYRAVEVRPGVFFIDFLVGESVKTHDVSMVLDRGDGLVTTADTSFISRDGKIRTHTRFLSGRVLGTGEIEPRRRTDKLVGKRIYYRYSETEAYEHIYLNAGTFAWQCVRGGEKGLADVEETKAFELADDIVIFFWTETVMPVDSFLVVDLKYRRSIGRMFCWEQSTLDFVHLPFDSRFTVLNETVHPTD